MSMRIKTGDRVYVLSGKDRGKEGKVLRRNVGKDLIVVENVNMVTKSVKPTKKNPKGGLVKQEAALHVCKVMLVCPSCGKHTRIGRAFLDNGRKVRVCKQCGEVVDKV